jgi:hypothetical protein
MTRMVTFYDPGTGAVQFSSTVQLPLGVDPNVASPEQWEAARAAMVEAVGLPCVVGEASANQCVVAGSLVEIVKAAPTLEQLKADLWAALKRERNEREKGGFVYLGYLMQSDELSVLRINTRAQAARAAIEAGTELVTYWKTTDNSTIRLDAHQMAAMPSALSEQANDLHIVADFLRQAIEAADTPEEVASVVWPD